MLVISLFAVCKLLLLEIELCRIWISAHLDNIVGVFKAIAAAVVCRLICDL